MELSTKFDPTKQTEEGFLKDSFLKTPSPEIITVYFGFGTALRYLREGKRLARKDWEGLQSVTLKETLIEVRMEHKSYLIEGFLTADLLATDWFIYDAK